MSIMAIDPGDVESAYVIIDGDARPTEFGKIANHLLLERIRGYYGLVVIEMIASYGMPVGETVFETCVWIGRFSQVHAEECGEPATRIKRLSVKLHHCHDSRAKDANVTRALVDRFAPGQANYGKGSKIDPGWFYGFAADVWQAYALAVYAHDLLRPPTAVKVHDVLVQEGLI